MATGSFSPTGRGNDYVVTVSLDAATAVDRYLWQAPRRCKLLEHSTIHSTAGAAGSTYRPRKITADAVAPGAAAGATVKELTTAAVALDATANTPRQPALSATEADRIFQEGDLLAIDVGATAPTGLVGLVLEFRFLAM